MKEPYKKLILILQNAHNIVSINSIHFIRYLPKYKGIGNFNFSELFTYLLYKQEKRTNHLHFKYEQIIYYLFLTANIEITVLKTFENKLLDDVKCSIQWKYQK